MGWWLFLHSCAQHRMNPVPSVVLREMCRRDTPAHASRHCITFWWNIVLSGCSYISHYNPVRVDFTFSSCRNCIRSSNHQTHASGVLWFYFGWPWVYPVLTVCHAGHAVLKTFQGTVTIHTRPFLSVGLVANTYWPAALQRKKPNSLEPTTSLVFLQLLKTYVEEVIFTSMKQTHYAPLFLLLSSHRNTFHSLSSVHSVLYRWYNLQNHFVDFPVLVLLLHYTYHYFTIASCLCQSVLCSANVTKSFLNAFLSKFLCSHARLTDTCFSFSSGCGFDMMCMTVNWHYLFAFTSLKPPALCGMFWITRSI